MTEIETRQLGQATFEKTSSNKKQRGSELSTEKMMMKKHHVLADLMRSINRNRIGKLSSILKSKYDWKEFLSTNKLKSKIEYHRKDGFLEKNALKNN